MWNLLYLLILCSLSWYKWSQWISIPLSLFIKAVGPNSPIMSFQVNIFLRLFLAVQSGFISYLTVLTVHFLQSSNVCNPSQRKGGYRNSETCLRDSQPVWGGFFAFAHLGLCTKAVELSCLHRLKNGASTCVIQPKRKVWGKLQEKSSRNCHPTLVCRKKKP